MAEHVSGSSAPPLCAKGCGFFGSAATNNLCSECYNDCISTAAGKKNKETDKVAAPDEQPACQDSNATAPAALAMAPAEKTKCTNEEEEGTSSGGGAAILCANRCGFFGSAATKNLCSSCYKNSTKSAVDAVSPSSKVVLAPALSLTEPPPAQISSGTTASAPAVKAAPNRCSSCRKKVGLLGFPCRCGSTFCSMQRYPEKHACDFDFKTAGRAQIAKNNPLVMAPKINKI